MYYGELRVRYGALWKRILCLYDIVWARAAKRYSIRSGGSNIFKNIRNQ